MDELGIRVSQENDERWYKDWNGDDVHALSKSLSEKQTIHKKTKRITTTRCDQSSATEATTNNISSNPLAALYRNSFLFLYFLRLL